VYSELPGADDNASGAAGLLEAARLLASHTPDTPVELVAYSTEEPPFFRSPDMGSAIHASSLRESNTQVIAMIGLEMIGYFSEVQPALFTALRLLYPSTGDFIVVAGRWADRALIREVKKSMRGASALDVRSYCGPTDLGSDLSDHRNYWGDHSHAVMVTDTAFIRNPNYHSKADTPDTLDYSRMASVVDGVVNAVLTLAGKD
jgi:Zn-dependent M28 family amino/carboxypeptidase